MTNYSSLKLFLTVCILSIGVWTSDIGIGFAHSDPPIAVKGVLDLRQWNFKENGPVKLDGEWEFYYHQLISPDQFSKDNIQSRRWLPVPSTWNDFFQNKSKLFSQGYATYRLIVRLPQRYKSLPALRFQSIGTSFICFVNHQKIAQAGTLGMTKETTVAGYLPQVSVIVPHGQQLEIVMYVANFQHRFSGIWESILIGDEKDIRDIREKKLMFNSFLFGIAFIMGFYHLGLYLLRRSDTSPFYFGIFCFLISARMGVTGEQYVSHLYPTVSWELLRKIEYISIYLGIAVSASFFQSVFPNEFSKKFRLFLILFGIPLTLVALVTPNRFYSLALVPSQIIMSIAGCYTLYVAFWAVIRKRDGAVIFSMGFIFFTITCFNDIFYANMLISTGYWVPFGLFIFILSQSIILSMRFSKAFLKIEDLSNNLGRIIQNSPVGIFQITPEWSYISANAALAKIYGYETSDELISETRNIKFGRYVDPQDRDEFVSKITGNDLVKNFEAKHVRKDGTIIDVSINAYVIRNDKGEVAYYEGMLEDITEKKRAVALEIAKKSAENANRTKSEFLANMSHEIRTPMNGIIGMNALLLDTELNPEQREFAEIVKFSSESLLVLLNDILDFSKIESGKMELEFINFDLRKVVEDIAELLVIKAEEKALEFGFLIHHDVLSLLKGDPTRLRQILINLAGNAIKFTERGSVFINVTLQKETDKSVCIEFQVKDTGIGISDDQKKRLFKTFSQADTSMTRKYGGTGLGLSISKKLVEMMHGKIDVDNQLEKGSAFWFTAWFEKQKDETPVHITPVNLSDKKILIVDDTPINVEILSAYLNALGCRFEVAADGASAIHKLTQKTLKNDRYNVVIMDSMIAATIEEGLAEIIQSDQSLDDTKLVMLSSRALRGDAQKAQQIGFHAFLTKPIKQKQLLECLQALFGYVQNGQAKEKKPLFVTHSTIEASKRRSIRILLAEDNNVNQKLALAYLKKFGFKADAVETGKMAIDALKRTDYTVILMDVQMPDMDGLEATRMIRNTNSDLINSKIPIIAMTAHAMREDREKCLAAGMNDYISKPINPQYLLDKIEYYVKRGQENQM